jgi:hypothetical protein
VFRDVIRFNFTNTKFMLALGVHISALILVHIVVFDVADLLLDVLEGNVALYVALG